MATEKLETPTLNQKKLSDYSKEEQQEYKDRLKKLFSDAEKLQAEAPKDIQFIVAVNEFENDEETGLLLLTHCNIKITNTVIINLMKL